MKNILILLILFSSNLYCQTEIKNWQLGPFVKPAGNPVMQADSTFLFNCPVKKQLVQWQKADVFNPAAIVRNNKVYVLFRAEDVPGVGIGMRTSIISIAVSEDGIHFKKNPEPVLYPDSSQFIKYDYPGGQALFDAKHPERLIDRCSTYFIKPDLPHEIKGQYTSGTTFIEGLVFFKSQYFLYYGTADSMVGVAVKR